MSLRNFISNKKLAALFILGGAILCNQLYAQKVSSPNIVIILADDLGYGDVSCFNSKSKIKTPNIDAIGSQGLIFTDAHTSSSVCTPTRYGILTGRYCWRSNLQKGVLNGYSEAIIPKEKLTIASMLKASGYTTACIGKWHLGWSWAKKSDMKDEDIDFSKPIDKGPLSLGFDYFYGISGSLDMPPYVYVENNQIVDFPDTLTENTSLLHYWGKGPAAKNFLHEQCLPYLGTKAKKYIKEKSNGSTPFFLYFALPAPHTPVLPTVDFRGKSGLGDYGDYVLEVDNIIGEIVKSLIDNHVFDNTILIITSDNGCSPAAGTKELEKLGHYPSAQFRGYKADLFEGGHREPFVISWPGIISKGSRCDQYICTTDFMATFAEIIGYKLSDNQGEDSFSFYSLLLNPSTGKNNRKTIVLHSYYGNFAIREAEWKLLLTPYSGGWSFPQVGVDDAYVKLIPKYQLYNLKKDPGERTNLSDKYPEKVNELKRTLIKCINKGRSTPGKAQKNDTPVNIAF